MLSYILPSLSWEAANSWPDNPLPRMPVRVERAECRTHISATRLRRQRVSWVPRFVHLVNVIVLYLWHGWVITTQWWVPESSVCTTHDSLHEVAGMLLRKFVSFWDYVSNIYCNPLRLPITLLHPNFKLTFYKLEHELLSQRIWYFGKWQLHCLSYHSCSRR